jgi:putative heme iron utilization protein
MSETITAAVSDRICKHMNDDHADAVLTYAKVYGQETAATAAKMESIDPEGMNLTAEVNGDSVPVRVVFDHPLQNAKEAHHVLVEMLKQTKAE